MIRRVNKLSIINVIIASVIIISVEGCAGKLAPNATPEAQSKFKKLQIVSALSDFQDGVIAANHAEWLSKGTADSAVIGVLTAVDAIEASEVDGNKAKAVALKMLDDLNKILKDPKLVPYINSVKTIVEAL